MLFPRLTPLLLTLCALGAQPLAALDSELEALLPPVNEGGSYLCPRDFLKPGSGHTILELTLAKYPDKASWEAHASFLRTKIREGVGLAAWPVKTPLNPVRGKPRDYAGYSVENVAIEAMPGYFVTGNLYRPLGRKGPFPVVLSPHGHGTNKADPSNFEGIGRFSEAAQLRCATLARMGAIVFAPDAFAYGESALLHAAPEEHRSLLAMPLQLWGNVRGLDFLLSLPDADASRVGVTGESGGGTQTFLLAALDPRVTVSVPVAMVSSYFFGGCPCESGHPIHRSQVHFASNAIIAALTAPRPQLLVSDGGDWTLNTPKTEYPFLRSIYARYGSETAVENVHLPTEGHNYGPSKRQAMYRFMARHLGLDIALLRKDGTVDESPVRVQRMAELRLFGEKTPVPAHARKGLGALAELLRR